MKKVKKYELLNKLNEESFGKGGTYIKLNKIGEGGFGAVYKGHSSAVNSCVAIKNVRINTKRGLSNYFLFEISLLKQLSHPNIICLHDVIIYDREASLIFEYVPFDLRKLISTCQIYLPIYDITIIIFQLLKGISFIHERKIIHRDLKPANVLVSTQGIVKLADFGLALPFITYHYKTSSIAGTYCYIPIDVIFGSTEIGEPFDIWSLACVMYELFTKSHLFIGKNRDEMAKAILNRLGKFDEKLTRAYKHFNHFKAFKGYLSPEVGPPPDPFTNKVPEPFVPLLKKMLNYLPENRPSAKLCLEDGCFDKIKKDVASYKNHENLTESEISARFLSKFFFDTVAGKHLC